MISREEITKILTYAAMAPSGSNSQPWKFRVLENRIDVIALPEKDHPVLNIQNRGTWVAHGALLENLSIAASALGYNADITIFPDINSPNLTARVMIEKKQSLSESLFEAIPKRVTNRKPYQKTPLSVKEKELLQQHASILHNRAQLFLIENSKKLETLGSALAVNEIVMLENKTLHRLFFDEIVWTKKEEQEKKSGLYLKTMELEAPKEKILKILRHWPIMRIANALGFARKAVAADNAKMYASCAAMGLITVSNEDRAFIDAGRLMERIWLQATSMSLGFQLVTGVLFLKQGIDRGNTAKLSDEHLMFIREAYQTILNAFSPLGGSRLAEDGESRRVTPKWIPAVLFRIGNSAPPTAYSSKKLPDIEFVS